jgi:hypothetical protein
MQHFMDSASKITNGRRFALIDALESDPVFGETEDGGHTVTLTVGGQQATSGKPEVVRFSRTLHQGDLVRVEGTELAGLAGLIADYVASSGKRAA